MRLAYPSLVAAACVVAAFGCNRSKMDRVGEGTGDRSGVEQPAGVTTITGANVNRVGNTTAIDRISAGRCARELACNNVGPDKHFVNHDLCVRELRTSLGEDFKAGECPRGIDNTQLDECLEAIRTESCENPIDTLSRLAACRSSDLCIKAE